MKSNEATIFVFIASIIIGILISTSMNFKKVNNKVLLTPSEYQEAYDYVNKLNKEIDDLESKYNSYRSKIREYNQNKNDKDKVLSDVDKEIFDNEMSLGNIDVEGEGILVNLDDATGEFQSDIVDSNYLWSRTVHDTDIINIINELKVAGAEVISLNGQRITDRSDIFCWGVFIELDGIKIPAPFNIKAIGNKDKLYSYMTAEGGYISFLKVRGINASIYKQDKIKILSTDNKIDIKYMKEAEK